LSNLAYIEHYTVEDWKRWEDDWELIYGHPYMMAPSPIYGHQFVVSKIVRVLDEALDDCPKCNVLAEIDYYISDDTVVRPDVLAICYQPKENITKTPEIIFEVVSKSSKKRDEITKKELYEEQKVPYYCIVYPDKKEAFVYHYQDREFVFDGKFSNKSYTFEVKECKVEFSFSKIWQN